MIEVIGLTKRYGGKLAVNDISFKINEGEIVGFLGPNGAGKSTTMNMITGYISASAGNARIADIDVLENPIAAKRHIGYLPEQPPLYVDMTVNEYLDFIYDLKKVKSNRAKHISDICDLVGISNVRARIIKNLSKGYKQRVGLAQALIGDPDVLILDEPTVGLDPKQIIEIRNVIRDLGKKRTIILSTHILPEVSAVCERVLVINNGKIVADDKPEKLSVNAAHEHKYTVRVSGEVGTALRVLRGIEGVKLAENHGPREEGANDFLVEAMPDIDIRIPMFRALAGADLPILMLKPQDVSLEDVFLKLVTDDSKHSAKAEKSDKEGKEDAGNIQA